MQINGDIDARLWVIGDKLVGAALNNSKAQLHFGEA
jgi:hypothetical protein